LAAAISLVQRRGYNAFSFRDLAEDVGIRTASIHYYFPTKADLGRAILEQHRRENAEFFKRIDAAGGKPRDRLNRFFDAFQKSYGDGKNMCLGGVMAIDAPTLPEEIVSEIRSCYGDHEAWLARTLLEGRRSGDLQFDESPERLARAFFDALEGALLASRAFGRPRRVDDTISCLLDRILT
jgi:TetR/AcrR family transcriptional repressor of nem operon